MHLSNLEWFRRFLPALAWTLLTFLLSISPSPQLPEAGFISPDKLGHLFFYALMFYLWWYGCFISGFIHSNNRVFIYVCIAVFCCGFGVLMEYIQFTYFPHRNFETADMLSNTLGVLAALGYAFFCKK